MADESHLYSEAVRVLRHDARNLLNGVAIMAEHFARSDDKKSQQFAQYLEDKVKAMVRLTERADLLAAIGEAHLGDHEAEAIVRAAHGRLAMDQPAPRIDMPGLTLHCDPQLAGLAIEEVLANALLTGAPVTVSGEGSSIIVRDQGQGVAEAALPLLLTPFRGARRAGGSSLGLPIASAAMEAQGGSIDLQTTDGAGTVVTLRFGGA